MNVNIPGIWTRHSDGSVTWDVSRLTLELHGKEAVERYRQVVIAKISEQGMPPNAPAAQG